MHSYSLRLSRPGYTISNRLQEAGRARAGALRTPHSSEGEVLSKHTTRSAKDLGVTGQQLLVTEHIRSRMRTYDQLQYSATELACCVPYGELGTRF